MKPIKKTINARLNFGDATVVGDMMKENCNPVRNQYTDDAAKKRIAISVRRAMFLRPVKGREPSLPQFKISDDEQL